MAGFIGSRGHCHGFAGGSVVERWRQLLWLRCRRGSRGLLRFRWIVGIRLSTGGEGNFLTTVEAAEAVGEQDGKRDRQGMAEAEKGAGTFVLSTALGLEGGVTTDFAGQFGSECGADGGEDDEGTECGETDHLESAAVGGNSGGEAADGSDAGQPFERQGQRRDAKLPRVWVGQAISMSVGQGECGAREERLPSMVKEC